MTVYAHHREGPSGSRELGYALLITAGIMVIELFAGVISGSLALMADAGHMLTDTLALSLALFASWIAARPATSEKTYGYYRTEILAALINGVALWLIVIWIYYRAFTRLTQPTEILTGPMLIAAVLGLVANLASGRILFKAQAVSLNVRGAWLHVLGDALGSCGVITAGLLIRFKGWTLADPLVSMFIGMLIAISSWILIKRSVNILLEGVPRHLEVGQITHAMRQISGVREVHDLHVWTITTGMEAMSGHIIVDALEESGRILEELNRVLSDQFGITHTTFQLEPQTEARSSSHPPA